MAQRITLTPETLYPCVSGDRQNADLYVAAQRKVLKDYAMPG